MTVAFDLPASPPSLIRRLDPRWKLAMLLFAALGCVTLRAVGPALTGLAGALLLVALARLPLRWYALRLAPALGMFALFLIWLPFQIEDGAVRISWPGLERLIVLSANLSAMLSLMLVLLATTPIHDTFKAARALRLPRLLVLLLLLTYRYVFLLMEEFARLRNALRVRGFRNRANLHSYRTIGQVAGTLLVRGHDRSERVAQAMRARGFDGEFRSLDAFSTRRADVLTFLLITGCAAGLLAWDYSVRA
jgi:cobalt/nickel transport system permease protein